jgi:hypothetical protein
MSGLASLAKLTAVLENQNKELQSLLSKSQDKRRHQIEFSIQMLYAKTQLSCTNAQFGDKIDSYIFPYVESALFAFLQNKGYEIDYDGRMNKKCFKDIMTLLDYLLGHPTRVVTATIRSVHPCLIVICCL